MWKVFTVILLLSLPTVNAVRVAPELKFAVPPNTTKSLDLILPDDFGMIPEQKDYYITLETKWPGVDLTEQTVTTDLNNTVKIPINFPAFGKKEGYCSPYHLVVKVESLGIKEWSGEVCVSGFEDVDFESDIDIFDLGFEKTHIFSEPNTSVKLDLLLSSSQHTDVDIFVKDTGVSVSPRFASLSFPKEKRVSFTILTPEREGRYEIEVMGRVKGCSFCEKHAVATLYVGKQPNTSFSLNVFPKNLDVRVNEKVNCSLRIHNYGSDKIFSLYLNTPPGIKSDFYADIVEILPGEEKVINFTLIPREPKKFYEIKVGAVSGGVDKYVNIYLSTDEMLTDLLRKSRTIPDRKKRKEIENRINTWYVSSEKNVSYLNEYRSLQELIESSKKIKPAYQENKTHLPGSKPKKKEKGIDFWFIVIPVIILILVAIYFYNKKEEEWTYQ